MCSALNNQVYPDIVTDNAGGAIAYWDDYRRGSDVDIYAQRISQDGTVGSITTGVPQSAASVGSSLEAPRPNPVTRDLVVSFTLPGSGPARLALFDMGGRVVRVVDLSSFGPGRHAVHLQGIASMSPGVYMVRLSAAGVSLARKIAIVR